MRLSCPIIIIVLLLGSCQRGIYIPDKVNSPGLKEKGEGKFDLSVKPQKVDSGGSRVSFSSDISFAPLKHVGIMASYRSVINKAIREPEIFYNYNRYSKFNGSRVDIGAGYFNKISQHGMYEVYGGYGNGVIRNEGSIDSGVTGRTNLNYTANYSRFFVQCAAGFDNDDIVSFMGGFRLTMQQYYHFESADPMLRYSLIPDQTLDLTNQSFVFFEPYIEVQVGYKFIRFNYQFGCASQVSGPNLKYDLGLPYMTFGAMFYYSPKYFRHNKSEMKDRSHTQ